MGRNRRTGEEREKLREEKTDGDQLAEVVGAETERRTEVNN
jgi:hypothetical protein